MSLIYLKTYTNKAQSTPPHAWIITDNVLSATLQDEELGNGKLAK